MAAKRILLVDDEPAILQVVSLRLKSAGYEVVTAEDGKAGLEKARKERPDLIVLDVMLPKMEGYKVCRLLKFDDQYRHIPIILFSARAEDRDVAVGFECHADAYIFKPFEPGIFLGRIRDLLGG